MAGLFYLQFHAWRTFDWGVFLRQTARADPFLLLVAIAIIYFCLVLRAWRWKLFLRSMGDFTVLQLLPPTIIGFTGLALLGRPGELSRPYLIARRLQLPVSSQMAVWMVERGFDAGGLALLMALVLLFAPALRTLPWFAEFRAFAALLVAGVAGLAISLYLLRRKGEAIAAGVERRLRPRWPHAARRSARLVQSFRQGLNAIPSLASLLALSALSLLIWLLISLSFLAVVKAYPAPLSGLSFPQVILLVGFSMAGSVVNLPAVGGGMQLAGIAALAYVFGIPEEMAVSCGIMTWLVSIMVISPAGLWMAHRQHLSLRKLMYEAEEEEKEET